MSVAKKMFQAQLAVAGAESEVGDALDECASDGAWEDFVTDWYDESIEVYHNDLANSDTIAAKMFTLGFARCWVHQHSRGGSCACPVRLAPK